MTAYTHKASRFIRNSLEGIPNKIEDGFLSKLEDHICMMGQYIQQRHGMEAYRELLRAVCSDKER